MTTRKNTKRKLKAYEYKTFEKARRHGYTRKQFNNSVRSIKAWNSKSELQKEVTLDNLRRGRKRRQLQIKKEKFLLKQQDGLIEAYQIVSQSHYDARGRTPKGKKYKTLFEYSTNGFFENEPNFDTIEKMTRNSLISAFNSGSKGKGGYLKNSAFNELVEQNLKGLKVEKVKIRPEQLNNKLSAELTILNLDTHYKWSGNN